MHWWVDRGLTESELIEEYGIVAQCLFCPEEHEEVGCEDHPRFACDLRAIRDHNIRWFKYWESIE